MNMNEWKKLFVILVLFANIGSIEAMERDIKPTFYKGVVKNALSQKNKDMSLYCPVSSCNRHDQSDLNNEFKSSASLEGHLYTIHSICGHCYLEMMRITKFENYADEEFLEKIKKISFENRRSLINHCSVADDKHRLLYCSDCFHNLDCEDRKIFISMQLSPLNDHIRKHDKNFTHKVPKKRKASDLTTRKQKQDLTFVDCSVPVKRQKVVSVTSQEKESLKFVSWEEGKEASEKNKDLFFDFALQALAHDASYEDVVFIGEKKLSDQCDKGSLQLESSLREQPIGFVTTLCPVMSSSSEKRNQGIDCFACNQWFATEQVWQEHLLTCSVGRHYN